MIENYSIMSGGSSNLLVPIGEDGAIDDAFWPLIELFDADIWSWYVTTHRGFQMANPEKFEDWLTAQSAKWVGEHGGTPEQARRWFLEDHFLREPLSPWPPPQTTADLLRRRTAPAGTRGDHLFALTRADHGAIGFTVDVATLDALPDSVMVPDYSDLSIAEQLIAMDRLGAFSPSALRRLQERGIALDSIRMTNEDVHALLRFGLPRYGRVPSWGPGGRSRFVDQEQDDMTPAALSRHSWTAAQFIDFYTEDGPLVLVVGDTAGDYCFAHGLQRCGVQARWIPEATQSTNPALLDAAAFALSASYSPQSDDRQRVITSVSLRTDQLESEYSALRSVHWLSDVDIDVCAPSDVRMPPRRLPTLLDPVVMNEPLEEPFMGDVMARPVPPAYPASAKADDGHKLTWWIDVEDHRRPLPPRASLNELVVETSVGWRTHARCGRDAISYFSHQQGLTFGGSPLAQLVERPRLRFPPAPDVFAALFEWAKLDYSESQAGQFRRMSTELWGGLAEFAEDLNDRPTFDLLMGWLASSASGEDPGVRTGGGRRVLCFEDTQAVSGIDTDILRSKLDSYVLRGILRRGLVLKCARCRYFDWYTLGDVHQSFSCHRCDTDSVVTQERWRGGDEPRFYYDLSEVVLQALAQNADVPARAAALIAGRSRSFGERSETEVVTPNGKIEVDLLIIADGKIIIGEAKVGDRLGKSAAEEKKLLRRMKAVAEAITADQVVLASSTSFREATKSQVASFFADAPFSVEIVEHLTPATGDPPHDEPGRESEVS